VTIAKQPPDLALDDGRSPDLTSTAEIAHAQFWQSLGDGLRWKPASGTGLLPSCFNGPRLIRGVSRSGWLDALRIAQWRR